MSVQLKLLIVVLFAALVPLTVSALSTLHVHQNAYEAKVEELQQSTVNSRAQLADQLLSNAKDRIAAVARPIDWGKLSDTERRGALWLVYQQLDDIVAVQLVNEAGSGVGESVFISNRDDPDRGKHPLATLALIEAFSANMVLAPEGARTGTAFRADPTMPPVLPIGVSVRGAGGARWTLAVALSLQSMCEGVRTSVKKPLVLYLSDGQDNLLCTSAPGATYMASKSLRTMVGQAGGQVTVEATSGEPLLATVAKMQGDWLVVAQQPRADAIAAGNRIRNQTIFWIAISLLVALAGGWYLARDIGRPLFELTNGAKELAAGNLAFRLKLRSQDEFSRLAHAFNLMGDELQKRDAEIREWNRELQSRVDEQTRDLKQAQKQLLQSQKIASISSLAAGAAHEINNPLTTVMGMAHVASRRLKKIEAGKEVVEALETIETEAARISEIVEQLGSLAAERSGEGFAKIPLPALVERTVELVKSRLAQKQIELALDIAQAIPHTYGNQSELQELLLHLLNNSLAACQRGHTIRVRLSDVDRQMLKLEVVDTGCGIKQEHVDRIFEPFFTTKQDWEGRGLGLAIAHRVVESHHGTIHVDSKLGQGTTVTVMLPVYRAPSTLQ